MQTPVRARITDSPWFWLMVFSAAALVALQIMDTKYRSRQAQIERQFQGRDYAWRQPLNEPADEHDAEPSVEVTAPTGEYSTEENMIITLRPLRGVALALFCLATATLWAQRRQARRALAAERAA